MFTPYDRLRVWQTSWMVTLGSFVSGYNIGIVGAIMPENLKSYYNWQAPPYEAYHYFQFLSLGGLLGSLTAGLLADRHGRRAMLMVYDLIILVGCVIVLVPFSPFFLLARLLAGFSIGGFSCVVLHYIRETVPTMLFARVALLIQLQLTLGICTAYALALLLSMGEVTAIWLVLYEFQVIIAALHLYFLLRVYKLETPYYCCIRHWIREANEGLLKIYPDALRSDLIEENEVQDNVVLVKLGGSYFAFGREEKYGDLLRCRQSTGKLMRGGIMINFFQQTVGINGMLFYMEPSSTVGLYLLNLLSGLFNTLPVFALFFFIEHINRKDLLMIGNGGIAITLAIFAFVFQYMDSGWLFIVYVVFFEIGVGPLSWIYCGETLSLAATSIALAVNWTCSILVTTVFAVVAGYPENREFLQGMYLTFAMLALVSVVYFKLDLIETKHRTPHEIYIHIRGIQPLLPERRDESSTFY